MTGDYVLQPTGDLDIATASALREEWYALIDRHRPSRVVVDLAAVDFVDSSGLRLLVNVLKRQQEHGGSVAVVNATPMTQKLMRMTRIDALVPVTPRTAATVSVTSHTGED